MYEFDVPNYTRISAHMHVSHVSSLGVHGSGGALNYIHFKLHYII